MMLPLPDTAFYRIMARGHLTRTGHVLRACLLTDADGIARVVRACCPDEEI